MAKLYPQGLGQDGNMSSGMPSGMPGGMYLKSR